MNGVANLCLSIFVMLRPFTISYVWNFGIAEIKLLLLFTSVFASFFVGRSK